MDILRTEKLPYLLSGLIAITCLIFNNVWSNFSNDGIIEFKTKVESSEVSSGLTKTEYEYSFKNLSNHVIDSVTINFILEPDREEQKNKFVEFKVQPIGHSSIQKFDKKKIHRLLALDIAFMTPNSGYLCDVVVETKSTLALSPTLSINQYNNSLELKLTSPNAVTWILSYQTEISMVLIILLVGIIVSYMISLKRN